MWLGSKERGHVSSLVFSPACFTQNLGRLHNKHLPHVFV